MDPTQQSAMKHNKAADLVTLNVGGSLYTTTVATLTRYPDSMLGSMFSDRIPSHRDSDGHYIIDGDGPIFRHVLNFLRRSSLCLPHDFKEWDLLSAEADFFQIQELIDAVNLLKEKRSGGEVSSHEREFVEISFRHNDSEVSYSGTIATLKDIPTLHSFYLRYGSPLENINFFDMSADRSRFIEVYSGYGNIIGLRMKIYQETTQLGFRLLTTSTQEASKTNTILFGRNIDK